MEKLLKNLKLKIIQYIKNGGDIYAPRRELPYYENLIYIKKSFKNKTGVDYSIDEIYQMCGIPFSRTNFTQQKEYKQFLSFIERIKPFADEQGNVDSIRNAEIRAIDDIYYDLKNYADKYGCSPFDFLVLTTPFKMKKAYISLDYIKYVQQQLKEAYPDGNLKGIRHQNPHLYNNLRHIRYYLPEQLTMEEVANFLGFYNDEFVSSTLETMLDEGEVVKKILALCPNRNATKLRELDITLYHNVVTLSRMNDQTIYQWLNNHNIEYDHKLDTPRFSKASIDTQKRALLLLTLKNEFLKEYDLENANDLEKYLITIEVMKKVIKYINDNNLTYQTIKSVEDLDNDDNEQNL